MPQSYRAYRKWVEVNGEEPLLPGLNMTHEQVNIITTSINIVVIANIIIIIIPILNPHRGVTVFSICISTWEKLQLSCHLRRLTMLQPTVCSELLPFLILIIPLLVSLTLILLIVTIIKDITFSCSS